MNRRVHWGRIGYRPHNIPFVPLPEHYGWHWNERNGQRSLELNATTFQSCRRRSVLAPARKSGIRLARVALSERDGGTK